jgi:triosephosphate isomerase (TIM)
MRSKRKIFYKWRMNGSSASLASLADALRRRRFNAEVVLFVPRPYVELAVRVFAGTAVAVGGLDCPHDSQGQSVGGGCAHELWALGATHVLLHHWDRGHSHRNTLDTVARKVEQAVSNGLSPVVCVGETEEERDDNETRVVLQRQIAPILRFVKRDAQRLTLVYEPIWAWQAGDTATPGAITHAHLLMRHLIQMSPHGSSAMGTLISILGTTVADWKAAQALFSNRDVDGALVMSSGLDDEAFIQLLTLFLEFEPV